VSRFVIDRTTIRISEWKVGSVAINVILPSSGRKCRPSLHGAVFTERRRSRIAAREGGHGASLVVTRRWDTLEVKPEHLTVSNKMRVTPNKEFQHFLE
jgi:hypothetical protein